MTARKKPTNKSRSDNVLKETFNWVGEPDVFQFLVNRESLTNAFRKLASKPARDANLRKCLEATYARVHSKYRGCSRKQARQMVVETHSRAAVYLVERLFFRLLREDAADLLSILLSVAVDNAAEACGAPRAERADSINALLKQRAKRVKHLLKTGRILGQTRERQLSKRERANEEKRLERTLAAIDAIDAREEITTRVAVAKEIGITSKQFGRVWLPYLLTLTGCESWEEFISRKHRTGWAKLLEARHPQNDRKGSQKHS